LIIYIKNERKLLKDHLEGIYLSRRNTPQMWRLKGSFIKSFPNDRKYKDKDNWEQVWYKLRSVVSVLKPMTGRNVVKSEKFGNIIIWFFLKKLSPWIYLDQSEEMQVEELKLASFKNFQI